MRCAHECDRTIYIPCQDFPTYKHTPRARAAMNNYYSKDTLLAGERDDLIGDEDFLRVSRNCMKTLMQSYIRSSIYVTMRIIAT